ncbi:MAG TPA: response regulator [Candidatus Saccharimonadales bacterium]|nr:response regulator [Candidatus Saccharimonadales bacterium]
MAAKIMLVEDDTNLSDIYKARLEAEGFGIVSAADGEAALALAVKEKPDLIISDVMMPKISGFDMLDILRSTDGIKETKVIMMTALSQAEDQARANKLGANRYLVKSQVTLEDVIKVVHEVLGDEEPEEPAADTATEPVSSAAPTPAAPATPVADPPAEPAALPATPAPVEPLVPTPAPAEPIEPPTPPPALVQPPAPTPAPVEPAVPSVTSIPVVDAPAEDVKIVPAAEEKPPTDETIPEPTVSKTTNSSLAVPAVEPTEPAPVTDNAVQEAAKDNGQSVSDEQSDVLDQIKNFVDKQEETSAAKPKAVDTTVAKIEPPANIDVPQEQPVSPSPISAVASSTESSAPDTTENENIEHVTIANKKVIQPPEKTDAKPSITELLAKEDSHSANLEPYATAPVSPANDPKDNIDPNSIAL